MKQQFFLLLYFFVFTSSCATKNAAPADYVRTVNSDMYPIDMSRDQYYEEMGRAYSNDLQSQKAIDEYRLALLHNPERVSAHIALSDEYRKTQMNHLAVNELTEVLKIQPNNNEALLRLADLYISEQIYSKAKEILAEVLVSDKKNDQARWSLVYIFKLEKNYTEAEKYLNQILESNQNKAKLLFEKAILAKQLNHADDYSKLISLAYSVKPHDKAITLEMKNEFIKRLDFDSALIILNHYSESHDFDLEISQSLTFVAVQMNQYDLALAELRKQQKLSKNAITTDIQIAHVYFLSGELQKAKLTYLNVLTKSPKLDEASYYLAQIYLSERLFTEAKPLLSDIRPSSKYFIDAQVRLAMNQEKNGQSMQAILRLEKALKQRPDQLEAYKAYSDMLLDFKKYQLAVSVLEGGINSFPNDEELQIKAAIANYQNGNEIAFKKHIERALALNPENAEIYSNLAELWYQKKFDPKDIEIFAKKAIDYQTKNKNMKPLLAWALLAQDRTKGSVSLFEKFYEENPSQPFYAEALSKVYAAADIPIKSNDMKKQALKLQTKQNLRSEMGFDLKRIPASIENP